MSSRDWWLICSILVCSGCSADGVSPPPPPPPPGTGMALEDVGQFSFPIFVTAPPADQTRIFVVEKRGTIQVVPLPSGQTSTFLDLRGMVSTGSEQGLLGLAFHPDFASNGMFIVNYTDVAGDTRISLFRATPPTAAQADAGSEQVLVAVDQPFANHNGGTLAFGPDGMLYLGLGDGGGAGDPDGNGQKRTTLLGKILRVAISPSGQLSIPSDNPFVGEAGSRAEIWSLGLRNPWRFSFDRENGDLYVGDVGQNELEEVDAVTSASGRGRGANFGWNIMEGSECFSRSSCDRNGLTLPVVEYSHAEGCSVTGGYVYRGSVVSIRGHYFYADFCGGWVRSFRLASGAATDAREWTALAPGGQITSFGEDAAGELYLTTSGGRVVRVIEQP